MPMNLFYEWTSYAQALVSLILTACQDYVCEFGRIWPHCAINETSIYLCIVVVGFFLHAERRPFELKPNRCITVFDLLP